jgi:lysozyme
MTGWMIAKTAKNGFSLGLMALILAACSTVTAEHTPKPGSSAAMIPVAQAYPVHGVDVSRYQGQVNWREAKAAGTRFAYIKATEGGDHADENFMLHWISARDAGIPHGAYHFYYWCRPVKDQIKWFLKNVPVQRDALPPVLDVEWYGAASEKCPRKVPKAEALADIKFFLQAVEKHYGKRPMIYTSIDFYRDVLVGELHDYPLWVRTVNAQPFERYGDRRWVMWQYTDMGRVPGIKGNVDRNAFAGTEDDFRRFASGMAFASPNTVAMK